MSAESGSRIDDGAERGALHPSAQDSAPESPSTPPPCRLCGGPLTWNRGTQKIRHVWCAKFNFFLAAALRAIKEHPETHADAVRALIAASNRLPRNYHMKRGEDGRFVK